MNNDFPPELQILAAHLDTQPGPVQGIFQYALALLMVEAGKAELINTTPSDNGPVCTFCMGLRFAPPIHRKSQGVVTEIQTEKPLNRNSEGMIFSLPIHRKSQGVVTER